MPEEDGRQPGSAQGRQPAFHVVEVVGPSPNVDPPSARESVPAKVERLDVEACVGQETAGSLVSAAVLAYAVDDEDPPPRRPDRQPLAEVQKGGILGQIARCRQGRPGFLRWSPSGPR